MRVAASRNDALEASVARIDADVLALKAGVEHTSKMGMSQFNKTSDRLDKAREGAGRTRRQTRQAQRSRGKAPRTPPAPVAAAVAAPKEVTGSIAPPAPQRHAAASKADAKAEVGSLPTVDRLGAAATSADGGALIEGRQGIFEVYAGDPFPGLGRIDAIRRQDGHWVVVTSKGLIVAR